MTVGILTEPVGKAMAKQVKRVNRDPDALLKRIEDLQAIIDTQRDVIERLRKTNGAPVEPAIEPPADYLSASAFARRNHVAVSTITRQFHKGKLKGRTDDKGHIFIRADQVYTKYRK